MTHDEASGFRNSGLRSIPVSCRKNIPERRAVRHSGFRRKKKFYETAGCGTDRFPMKKYLSETGSGWENPVCEKNNPALQRTAEAEVTAAAEHASPPLNSVLCPLPEIKKNGNNL